MGRGQDRDIGTDTGTDIGKDTLFSENIILDAPKILSEAFKVPVNPSQGHLLCSFSNMTYVSKLEVDSWIIDCKLSLSV